MVGVEFTSDIFSQTTFNAHRNQFARTIDAGMSMLKKDQRLIVLLCSPLEFYRKKSRFYYYKLQEYADLIEIRRGIGWRELAEIKQLFSERLLQPAHPNGVGRAQDKYVSTGCSFQLT